MGAVMLGNLILSSYQDLHFARVGPPSPPACRSEQEEFLYIAAARARQSALPWPPGMEAVEAMTQERAAQHPASQDLAPQDAAKRDQAAQEVANLGQAAKGLATGDQAAQEVNNLDQAAQEPAHRDQAAQEAANGDQAAQEPAHRDQAAQEAATPAGRRAHFKDADTEAALPLKRATMLKLPHLTDSAGSNTLGLSKMRGSPEQPSREHSVTTGQGDASQHGRDASSSGFPGYYHGTTRSGSESALQTSFDPSKLMSTAVQHGSEAGNERSALNTQASLLEEELEGELQEGEAPGTDEPMLTARPSPTQAELESMHIGSSRELGPGVAISSWKKRWDSSQEPHRKRPLDDSALEVETPGDPDTLDKLWPLMAAVQRRQTAGSSPRNPSSFRLAAEHSVHPSGERSPRMTRAHTESLTTHPRGPASGKGMAKQPGFFHRHTSSSPPGPRSSPRDRYDSLRLLETRKERRMDPQERVRLWLEQSEQHLPPQSPRKVAAIAEATTPLQPARSKIGIRHKLAKPSKERQNPLQRLFACFAL